MERVDCENRSECDRLVDVRLSCASRTSEAAFSLGGESPGAEEGRFVFVSEFDIFHSQSPDDGRERGSAVLGLDPGRSWSKFCKVCPRRIGWYVFEGGLELTTDEILFVTE